LHCLRILQREQACSPRRIHFQIANLNERRRLGPVWRSWSENPGRGEFRLQTPNGSPAHSKNEKRPAVEISTPGFIWCGVSFRSKEKAPRDGPSSKQFSVSTAWRGNDTFVPAVTAELLMEAGREIEVIKRQVLVDAGVENYNCAVES